MIQGLQLYGLLTQGCGLIVLICIIVGISFFVKYSFDMNYQKTTGNITVGPTSSNNIIEKYILTYTIDKEYRKELPATQVVNGKVEPIHYYIGSNTIYYPKDYPDSYNIGFNPLYISQIICVVFVFILFASIIKLILSYMYPELGAIFAGVDILGNLFNSNK